MTSPTAEAPEAEAAARPCAICGEAEGHVAVEAQLDCPDCLARGEGHSKIGNKRATCRLCNRFAQRIIRAAGRALQREHPEHYDALRAEAEIELYLAEIGATSDA